MVERRRTPQKPGMSKAEAKSRALTLVQEVGHEICRFANGKCECRTKGKRLCSSVEHEARSAVWRGMNLAARLIESRVGAGQFADLIYGEDGA